MHWDFPRRSRRSWTEESLLAVFFRDRGDVADVATLIDFLLGWLALVV